MKGSIESFIDHVYEDEIAEEGIFNFFSKKYRAKKKQIKKDIYKEIETELNEASTKIKKFLKVEISNDKFLKTRITDICILDIYRSFYKDGKESIPMYRLFFDDGVISRNNTDENFNFSSNSYDIHNYYSEPYFHNTDYKIGNNYKVRKEDSIEVKTILSLINKKLNLFSEKYKYIFAYGINKSESIDVILDYSKKIARNEIKSRIKE